VKFQRRHVAVIKASRGRKNKLSAIKEMFLKRCCVKVVGVGISMGGGAGTKRVEDRRRW
jgi:hypothetical protein